MAIYRKGKAGMASNGVVTGNGTTWQDRLSLIRVGATILFPAVPGAIATISAIVSDTELRVIANDNKEAPADSDYVILIHDSITVDGLAQDVAETLRYYQGKESEIADALEFFKTFDWDSYKAMAEKVGVDAEKADTAAKGAKQSEQNASASKDSAAQFANEALFYRNLADESQKLASSSQVAAKESETKSKVSETNAKTSEDNALSSKNDAAAFANYANERKNEAESAASSAAQSNASAAGSKAAAETAAGTATQQNQEAYQHRLAAESASSSAAGSETASKNEADRAKREADRAAAANPDNQLKKDQNLADLADKNAARNNLGVGVNQEVSFGSVSSDSRGYDNGGALVSKRLNANGTAVLSKSRIYHEVQAGQGKTTIATGFADDSNEKYFQFSQAGEFTGTTRIFTGRINTSGQIESEGYVSCTGTLAVDPEKSSTGGNRRIAIQTTGGGDPVVNGWVNLIQGDFYNGWWQVGGKRGGGAGFASLDFIVNSGLGKEAAMNLSPATGQLNVTYGFTSDANPNNSINMYVNGTITGGGGALIGGTISAGGFDQWRDRPAGAILAIPGDGSAMNIFKAMRPGVEWVTGMDCVRWAQGGGVTRLMVFGSNYEFASDGNARAANWVSTSDIRLKANLNPIESASSKVAELMGYTYYKRNNLIEDEHSIYTVEAGIIAQDLDGVLPEAVVAASENPDIDIKAVNYNGVVALLVNAFNEQRSRVDSLEGEIEELKSLVKNLISK